MAASARVTRGLSANSAFGRQVKAVAAKRATAQVNAVAAAAVRETDAIVSKEFVNDRAPDRRKTGRHLLGSFVCKVTTTNGGFPIVLTMSSLAESAKVKALEFGAPPHEIRARNASALSFPVGQRGSKSTPRAQRISPQRFGAAYAKRTTIVVPSVQHPGNPAHHMMKRGLEAAVQAAYHKHVTARSR